MAINDFVIQRQRYHDVSLFLESIVHIARELITSSVPIVDIDSAMVACDMAEDAGEDMREVAYFLQAAKQAAGAITYVRHYPGETMQYQSRTLVTETVVTRLPFIVVEFTPDSCIIELLKSISRLGVIAENSLTDEGTTVISLTYPWERASFEWMF